MKTPDAGATEGKQSKWSSTYLYHLFSKPMESELTRVRLDWFHLNNWFIDQKNERDKRNKGIRLDFNIYHIAVSRGLQIAIASHPHHRNVCSVNETTKLEWFSNEKPKTAGAWFSPQRTFSLCFWKELIIKYMKCFIFKHNKNNWIHISPCSNIQLWQMYHVKCQIIWL